METEGWHDAACEATSLIEGPDPARSTDIEFSSPKDLAASIALNDEVLIEPPSCSAKTNVLSYAINTQLIIKKVMHKLMQVKNSAGR